MQVTKGLPGGNIPQNQRSMGTTGERPPSIRAEGYSRHPAAISVKTADHLSGLYIPQNHDDVVSAGEGCPAIGAEGNANDLNRMPLEAVDDLAGLEYPTGSAFDRLSQRGPCDRLG